MFIALPTKDEVMYLTHEKYRNKSMRKEGSHVINVVSWLKCATKEAPKSDYAPVLNDTKSYKLFFGENKGLVLADDNKLVEAYLHAKGSTKDRRVTLVYRGLGAFTFTLED